MFVVPIALSEVLMVSCHFTPDKGWDEDMWCGQYRTAQNMCISWVDPRNRDPANLLGEL